MRHTDILALVDAGADVNEVEGAGNTPLHSAAYEVWVEGVQLLLQLGAKVNASNNAGDTPWHWATNMGHQEVVQLLEQVGWLVNLQCMCNAVPGSSLDGCTSKAHARDLLYVVDWCIVWQSQCVLSHTADWFVWAALMIYVAATSLLPVPVNRLLRCSCRMAPASRRAQFWSRSTSPK